jgi:hypothetical protein
MLDEVNDEPIRPWCLVERKILDNCINLLFRKKLNQARKIMMINKMSSQIILYICEITCPQSLAFSL